MEGFDLQGNNEKKLKKYIDEYRKISTLEKLPQIEEFKEINQDKNKFIRLKIEPETNLAQNKVQKLLLGNNLVQEAVDNLLEQEKETFKNQNQSVSILIGGRQEKSAYNKGVDKEWKFNFKGKAVSPPRSKVYATSKQGLNSINNLAQKRNYEESLADEHSSKGKNLIEYDFHQIQIAKMKNDQSSLQQGKAINQLKNEQSTNFSLAQIFDEFSEYKNLQAIETLNEYEKIYDNFTYNLKSNKDNKEVTNYLHNQFVYQSVHYDNYELLPLVSYFRDLGLPARDIDKYSSILSKQRKGVSNDQNHLLHLLNDGETVINKENMTYNDIANICMGRVTTSNAYLCQSGHKVTEEQYKRLIRRLNRYQQKKTEANKVKKDALVNTNDNDLDKTDENEDKILKTGFEGFDVSKKEAYLVNEILQLRQGSTKLNRLKTSQQLFINTEQYQKEINQRVQKLLKELYDLIMLDAEAYPLESVTDYLEILDQLLVEEYKDGKLLWFILDCYEEIANKMVHEDTLFRLYKIKKNTQHKLLHYKDKKMINETELREKNLFAFRDKKQVLVPTNDRSPTKTQNKNHSVTPHKGRGRTGNNIQKTINQKPSKL